jgi:RNA polymerase sigma-70 factor (ECF subfamily)
MDVAERIESLLLARDFRAVAHTSIDAYGPEVLGFLVSLLRDENDASEVFSQACEDMWSGLAGFEARSSFRTWFYAIARHAAARFRRSPHQDPRRRKPLSEVSDLAEKLRSRTLPHLRTDVKDQFASIRNSLDEDDRALLVLRVDRDMSWSDIARIFSVDDQSDQSLARVGARLRKQFQVVKDEIRQRARTAGLLSDHEP